MQQPVGERRNRWLPGAELPPLRPDHFLDHGQWLTHYWDQGTGRATVFLHGIGDSCLAFHPVLDDLSSAVRCIVPDMPGFGFTTRPERIDAESYVGWLESFLDELGLQRVTLVGHSLGGLLTLLFATARPERVSSVVLVAAAGLSRELPVFLRLMSLPLLPRLLYRPSLVMARNSLRALIVNPDVITPEYVHWSWQYNGARPGFAEHMRDVTRLGGSMLFGMPRQFVFADRLRELDAPLQLIWGERDPLFPVSHAHRAAEARPDADLVLLENVGHIPMLERPAQFSAAVTRFLA